MRRVLITGGGAPGIAGTIYALRKFYGDDLEIITVDARDDVVGKYMSDRFYKIPKAGSDDFINSLIDISVKERVDVILPQVTRELEILAENVEKFERRGIKVIVSSPKSLSIANNKYKLLKIAESVGYEQGFYKVVKSKGELIEFAEEVGFPKKKFVVKVPVSNGMRGLRIVTDKRLNLKSFIEEKPKGEFATLEDILNLFDQGDLELLCMEYYPGKEYTVDVYRSPITGDKVVVPRSRDVIRTGITFEGTIEKNQEIIEISEKLADELDLIFSFGFQFKLDENGKPKLLESNPRIQGTMIAAVMAGANMIAWSVEESLENPVDISDVEISWGMKFKRYWGGIGIYSENFDIINPFLR